MGWLALEAHDKFVPAWTLINGIAEVGGVNLQSAIRLLNLLNQQDLIDGSRPLSFYGHNIFDGYFLATDQEHYLCIEAMRQAVLSGTVKKVIYNEDGGPIETAITLDEGFKCNLGMNFFIRKQDVIKAIIEKKTSNGLDLPMPSCLQDMTTIPRDKPQKTSKKTSNLQAKFIHSLIAIHYGNEIANNPRSHIDGARGVIRVAFESNGLTAPSGSAVSGWINQIIP
ncbi:hypothetical protein [Budvicia aquatica]|uniref:hypothetical protein n=1 Tax=Budvicia aquatica TaxID=82979 RepID=UPI000FDA7734|nr:hypothetical protein [Budvicia aquatica]